MTQLTKLVGYGINTLPSFRHEVYPLSSFPVMWNVHDNSPLFSELPSCFLKFLSGTSDWAFISLFNDPRNDPYVLIPIPDLFTTFDDRVLLLSFSITSGLPTSDNDCPRALSFVKQ